MHVAESSPFTPLVVVDIAWLAYEAGRDCEILVSCVLKRPKKRLADAVRDKLSLGKIFLKICADGVTKEQQ
ncbi:hypothetical protein NUU61_007571 [Penicillium alfredii]|uniref:Uncharacterized protein n=1 Tax=Penicillium alfredii TaxID=1506179 RepID=A0A9W9JY59_9EURO|nr:uncharacterized protein NUU61_007571 [Penicillium alfredii]KAJ5086264.1 hypothetical protein NUU61_007571 [Penicillium alfredii]